MNTHAKYESCTSNSIEVIGKVKVFARHNYYYADDRVMTIARNFCSKNSRAKNTYSLGVVGQLFLGNVGLDQEKHTD